MPLIILEVIGKIMELSLIIDIVLVGIIVICAIIGLVKGFFKSILSLVGTVVSILIAVLLAKTVANALIGVNPFKWFFGPRGVISGWIERGLVKLSPVFSSSVESGSSGAADLTAAGIPAFLAKLLAGAVSKHDFSGHEALTLAEITAPMIAGVIWLIVVTILLFIILRIVISILNKFFRFLTKNKAISGVNRVLGFVVGAAKGIIITALLLFVAALFPNWKFLKPFNTALDKTVIAKPFNNVVYNYVGKNVNLDKILNDLFPAVETPPAEPGGEMPTETE